MLKIRRVEEAIADRYSDHQMKCPVHLSIGQEAVPVAVSAHLTVSDHVYSGHRCHAHYLAKGGSVPKMIAELHGRTTGCARGRGGSMHLVAPEVGMMGSSALVGGTIPIAVGSALGFKLSKTRNIAVSYFGDGASEEGIFYESLNIAAVKKLPVLFICENNLYATYSHQHARQANPEIHDRVSRFGMPASVVDGNDVMACYEAVGVAVERARNGEGPTFFEFKTYRYRDHVGPSYDDHIGYRTKTEVEEWMKNCPIEKFKKVILAGGQMTEEQIGQLEKDLKISIEEAFKFAQNSPYPEESEIFADVF